MNVDTGELVRLKEQERKLLIAGGFEPVPAELRAAAEKKLAGRDRTVVSLSSGGKLSKWARQRRKHQYEVLKNARGAKNRKADRKKKAAQESRRRNRG